MYWKELTGDEAGIDNEEGYIDQSIGGNSVEPVGSIGYRS